MTATRKFTVNSNSTSVNGTCYKGYVLTTYDILAKILGAPKEGSADGKTTCEWRIEFECGTVATIYDWKTSQTPKTLYKWHVGAKNHAALDYLEEILNTRVVSEVY